MSKKKGEFNFDLICIGGGSAGLACAKEASAFGAKTAVVDFVKPTPIGTTWGIGGTCVNVGCIPKKHMHNASLLGTAIHDATYFGWQIPNEEEIRLNWAKLVGEIKGHIKSTNWVIKVELRSKNIQYFNGMASFVDPHTISVNLPKGRNIITGRYIVIAIGGRPVYPDIPGALELGITSDDLFFLPKPPGKTLLVGAGYVGMECAGFLNEFGFNVTIVARGDILSTFDRDMVRHLKEYMESRHVTFLQNRLPKSLERTEDNRLLVTLVNINDEEEETDVFDTVIFAMGRKVLLEDLNVAAVGLPIDNGEIVVNESFETNVPNIFALGDAIKGPPKLTPVAVLAGRLLAARLFNNSTQLMDYGNVPTTIFTPLEYSCIGLSEEAAELKYGFNEIEVHHAYYHPIDFLISERNTQYCYIKVIALRHNENFPILGLHFIGPSAGEVLQGFAVAIKCGLTLKTLFSTLGVHISNAEEITNAKVTKRSGLDPSPPLYLG